MVSDPDDLAELLDPERSQGYYAVLSGDSGELVGFFCFGGWKSLMTREA